MQDSSASSKPVLQDSLRRTDYTELKKLSFWVAQLAMVIATIVGVYLAAQAGLKQAIVFDTITSTQSNYHLRRSLADELQANVIILRAYNKDYLSRAIPPQELKQNNPNLSRFVWETMKSSPATLETPSVFLNETQAFYRQVDDLISKGENRVFAASHAGNLMNQQLDHIEKELLPLLEENLRQLEKKLAGYGVSVTN